MKKAVAVMVLVLVMAIPSLAQDYYSNRTDTLNLTTNWTTVDYGRTYLKFVEVFLDSVAGTNQYVWIVEGTDTTMSRRIRVPRKSKDTQATISHYNFITQEDTLRLRLNFGTGQVILMRKPYWSK